MTVPRTGLAVGALCLLLAAGCGSSSSADRTASADPQSRSATASTSNPAAPTASQTASPDEAPTALAALALLAIKGRAPKTGYTRAQFGQAWADVDRNGCDTRTDILLATLTDQTTSGRCTVTSGTLDDPYTGTSIRYVRGGPSEVDIDHVVALSNAWQTGAFAFPFAKRVALANDPLNLLAVDAATNRQKGDGDAATWLPPNKAFRCDYVARQVAVKTKYELWVTAAEAESIRGILQSCPGQRLPDPGPAPTIASNTGGQPEPARAASVPPPSGGSSATYFRTCAEARAAGVAPIVSGTALYAANTHLDRDKDGLACE
ncbi:MAG: DUF1524 domain-containing protein [Actinomycetes bacterium]